MTMAENPQMAEKAYHEALSARMNAKYNASYEAQYSRYDRWSRAASAVVAGSGFLTLVAVLEPGSATTEVSGMLAKVTGAVVALVATVVATLKFAERARAHGGLRMEFSSLEHEWLALRRRVLRGEDKDAVDTRFDELMKVKLATTTREGNANRKVLAKMQHEVLVEEGMAKPTKGGPLAILASGDTSS